jgi:hypothetical protein
MPKIFKVMFSLIQNTKFIVLIMVSWDSFGLFSSLLMPKSKMENDYIFAQKNCMVFNFIMKNNRPKPKIF